MSLSNRARALTKEDDRFFFWKVLQDLWHPEQNPCGFVNLGVAENSLMHDVLSKHIHEHFALPAQAYTYGDGSKRLKSALCLFLNKHFQPVVEIQPSHLLITNGCSSAIEHLAWACANPGEYFLLGQPYYGTFIPDLTLRTGAHVEPVSFNGVDPVGVEAVKAYENALIKCQLDNRKVAGLILCHPHNPLGRCYSREALLGFMDLCQKYQIHLVSDEIYALSTFSNELDVSSRPVQFESCLSINTEGIIDPQLLHVVWGVSKDFGANGLRIGTIISQNNACLHQAIGPALLYSSISSASEHIVSNILEDETWTMDYITENQRRLKENFEYVASWAKQNGIPYAKGVNAAFFLWVDLATPYRQSHPRILGDVTQQITDALLKHKVFLASGSQFGAEQPGWFRIVFSQSKGLLKEGLERVAQALSLQERFNKSRL